jgi:hypothetical protein
VSTIVAVRNDKGQFDGPNPGRPRKFQDITRFQAAINRYFQTCTRKLRTPHLAGLAVALDCDRTTILNYEAYDDAEPFVHAIKSARRRCEDGLASLALTPKSCVHPALPIFLLKNNHGYRDVQEHVVERREFTLGVQVALTQHQAELVGLDERIRQIAGMSNETPLSPQAEIAPAVSPPPDIPVTGAQRKAKATPTRRVSPPSVA